MRIFPIGQLCPITEGLLNHRTRYEELFPRKNGNTRVSNAYGPLETKRSNSKADFSPIKATTQRVDWPAQRSASFQKVMYFNRVVACKLDETLVTKGNSVGSRSS